MVAALRLPMSSLLLLLLAAGATSAREVHRNKEDRRRAQLSPQKLQRIGQILARADATDGHARLEGVCFSAGGSRPPSCLVTASPSLRLLCSPGPV
eukprot:SAG22_NODE_1623_length_3962_cov_20.394253_6_plen_96_part_00